MSNHWYAYVGCGINSNVIENADIEGVKKLLELCPCKMQNEIRDNCHLTISELKENGEEYDRDTILRNVIDEYETEETYRGVSALFTYAIWEQEHISLTVAYSDDEEVILFEPYYPWCASTKEEKELTLEKLEEIFLKYERVLGIPEDKLAKPYYREVVGYC